MRSFADTQKGCTSSKFRLSVMKVGVRTQRSSGWVLRSIYLLLLCVVGTSWLPGDRLAVVARTRPKVKLIARPETDWIGTGAPSLRFVPSFFLLLDHETMKLVAVFGRCGDPASPSVTW